VRDLMAERSSRTGSAADFLRVDADRSRDGASSADTGWPKSPRALAGRLRRAPTFLRLLGIDIAFGREGRAGSRVIRMHARFATTVSTVSSVRDNAPSRSPLRPAGDIDDNRTENPRDGRTMLAVLTQNLAFRSFHAAGSS
jgi:hypothetical protein